MSQCTSITFGHEQTANIMTSDNKLISRLDEYSKLSDKYKYLGEQKEYKIYSCPKKYVMPKKPIVLSEERRKSLIERAKEIFEKYRLKNKTISGDSTEVVL